MNTTTNTCTLRPVETQRGAALIVGLIMLTLITVVVTSAFTLGRVDQQSVGNVQFRSEATAAANQAIEKVISSPFTDAPAAESIDVDIDNDGVTDYVVNFTTPTCMSATLASAAAQQGNGCSVSVPCPATIDSYETLWDLNATVSNTANGTAVQVHQGVRVLLSKANYTAVCT